MEQARALGQTALIRNTNFLRYYTSDLPRALHTTKVVLESASKANFHLILEPRIRETAKGAREGFSKHMTYAEALAAREKLNPHDPIPPLETEDDAWNRMYAFLKEVVQDITASAFLDLEECDSGPPCVFIMTHSGILRIFLRKMIGEKRLYAHPSALFDKGGMFYLPNTSVTILDVKFEKNEDDDNDGNQRSHHNIDVDVVELTHADHLPQTTIEAAYAE